jgi:hypothetical protein
MTPLAKALLAAIGALALGCTVSRLGTLETLPTGPVIPGTDSVKRCQSRHLIMCREGGGHSEVLTLLSSFCVVF